MIATDAREKKIVAFIVNGGRESAMGYRARSLATRLEGRYRIRTAYRTGNKVAALVRFLSFLRRERPHTAYVFDMAYSGVLAAWAYRALAGVPFIVETGDAIYELMRSTGNRGPVGLWLTRRFEQFSLRAADRIVVRGYFHQQLLAETGHSAELIQDGVDTREFKPTPANGLREQYSLDGLLTVGMVGSSIWSEKLGTCYGWELVELLRLLRHAPVKGIIIGDGTGLPRLKARCREYGIEDRVLFLGHVPYTQLPRYLNLIDVCLSTQTNDVVGQVRTTGKLPLYLAAGRYILASDVGEASRVLAPEMLVPYEGVRDEQYPRKLAARIEAILARPELLTRGAAGVRLAEKHFDYSLLAERAGGVIDAVLAARGEIS
jgi:glycosyltransferase involved in cell wall biosynthesis